MSKLDEIIKEVRVSGNAWEGAGSNQRKNGELYDINIKIGITRNYVIWG